jgi:glucokinase
MDNFIGIDIGGMSIKGMLLSAAGEVLAEGSVPTRKEANDITNDIVALVKMLEAQKGVKAEAVGVGCPGLIDSQNGTIVFAGNLGIENYPLAKLLSEKLSLPVKMTNDANAAALGEARFGAAMGYDDSILVTLGTGVGGGVILGGKLFEGNKSAGTEIGHMVIEKYGFPCTCGRRGCFEVYSSATALIKKTQQAMRHNTDSLMWKTYRLETVNGKTAFDYCDTDVAAREVVEWFYDYLACGLTNLANIFRPQVIMLGGGISEQGERLTVPVQKLLNKQLFGGTDFAPVKVVKASLGSRAGAYGAAALNMD